MLIAAVLFATVLLRFGIVLGVAYLILPKAFSCPRCADKLALIHHPFLRRLVPQVEHRWCLHCGWSGIVRRARQTGPLPQSRVISRAARS